MAKITASEKEQQEVQEAICHICSRIRPVYSTCLEHKLPTCQDCDHGNCGCVQGINRWELDVGE